MARMKRVQQRLLAPLDAADREIFLGLLMQLISGNNDQGRAPLRLPKQGNTRVAKVGGTRQR